MPVPAPLRFTTNVYSVLPLLPSAFTASATAGCAIAMLMSSLTIVPLALLSPGSTTAPTAFDRLTRKPLSASAA